MNANWIGRSVLGLSLVLVPLAAAAAKKKPSSTLTGTLNLNRATPEQLKMLPGVKDKAVSAIVAHREKQPFTRVEELASIEGFSKKRFEKLKPHLSVSGETTLRVQKGPRSPRRAKSGKRPTIP